MPKKLLNTDRKSAVIGDILQFCAGSITAMLHVCVCIAAVTYKPSAGQTFLKTLFLNLVTEDTSE